MMDVAEFSSHHRLLFATWLILLCHVAIVNGGASQNITWALDGSGGGPFPICNETPNIANYTVWTFTGTSHSVTSTRPNFGESNTIGYLNSSIQSSGFVFGQPEFPSIGGVYFYHCSVHPSMQGVLIVDGPQVTETCSTYTIGSCGSGDLTRANVYSAGGVCCGARVLFLDGLIAPRGGLNIHDNSVEVIDTALNLSSVPVLRATHTAASTPGLHVRGGALVVFPGAGSELRWAWEKAALPITSPIHYVQYARLEGSFASVQLSLVDGEAGECLVAQYSFEETAFVVHSACVASGDNCTDDSFRCVEDFSSSSDEEDAAAQPAWWWRWWRDSMMW